MVSLLQRIADFTLRGQTVETANMPFRTPQELDQGSKYYSQSQKLSNLNCVAADLSEVISKKDVVLSKFRTIRKLCLLILKKT